MDEWICERTTPDRLKCSEREEFFFLHKMPTNIVHRVARIIYQMQHFSIPFYFSLSFFFSSVDSFLASVSMRCRRLCSVARRHSTIYRNVSDVRFRSNCVSSCRRCCFFFVGSCARLWFALISTLRAFPWIPSGNIGFCCCCCWKWTTRDQTSICS